MSDNQKEREGATFLELAERYLRQLRRLWALVLVLTVLCSLFFAVRAKRSFVPMYEAKARFSISSSYDGDDVFSEAYYDNAAAQQLADSFPHLLSMDLMKELMIQQLDKAYINGTIHPYSVVGTNMFVLTVRSNNAQDAYDILEAVIACFPQVAGYMVENPRVDVLEEIRVPEQPINSFSWTQELKGGAIKGLGLGLLLVAAAALLTKTITSVHQLKGDANVPVLATFPQLATKKRRKQQQTMFTAQTDAGFAEALRGLALKVRKELQERGDQVVVVTSTVSGEGKTTTAVNLALTLSEDGSSVVLVDADLRNQSIARLYDSEGKGLLDCLKDDELDVMKCLQQIPESEVMYLSGSSAADWKYAVDQKQMRQVLNKLKASFDYVVMDTSPCAMVADTALLCRHGGSVLYVVRSDWAGESQILDHVSNLHERDVQISGFVFNGVARRKHGYGYGYGYGGRYGYGYGYGGYGYGYGSKKK